MVKKQIYLLVAVTAVMCVGGGIIFGMSITQRQDACKTDYTFIDPEPACEKSERTLTRISALENKITNSVNYLIADHKAINISVFFRDLTSKRWLGVNADENFSPGSLLKLPLLVTYYKLAEIEPTVLEEKITYKQTANGNDLNALENIKPAVTLKSAETYTVEELINYMVIYSDNNATSLLFDHINPQFLSKVFVDLGVYLPTSQGFDQDFVSVKTYSGILRSLYNASYLNRAMSEKALALLNKSDFKDGLVSGVPSDILIAHKFGERSVLDPQTNKVKYVSLHDCGIVYAKRGPYVLCIMTKGSDFNNLETVFKTISTAVYNDFYKQSSM
ncbi:class A beta-lactamase-related serine hydrolase [Candidatus Parcubacteria bacterium]|nr:class A beta-lactamase-related serine hydrolase [Candidatus Parcubacteria bacterium]